MTSLSFPTSSKERKRFGHLYTVLAATEYSWVLTPDERIFSTMMQHWLMKARNLAIQERRDPDAPKGAGKSVHCQQGLRQNLRAASGRQAKPAAAAASTVTEESSDQPWSTDDTGAHSGSHWKNPRDRWDYVPSWTPNTGEPWGTSRTSQWSGAPVPREHLPGNDGTSWSSSRGSYQKGPKEKDDSKGWQWR